MGVSEEKMDLRTVEMDSAYHATSCEVLDFRRILASVLAAGDNQVIHDPTKTFPPVVPGVLYDSVAYEGAMLFERERLADAYGRNPKQVTWMRSRLLRKTYANQAAVFHFRNESKNPNRITVDVVDSSIKIEKNPREALIASMRIDLSDTAEPYREERVLRGPFHRFGQELPYIGGTRFSDLSLYWASVLEGMPTDDYEGDERVSPMLAAARCSHGLIYAMLKSPLGPKEDEEAYYADRILKFYNLSSDLHLGQLVRETTFLNSKGEQKGDGKRRVTAENLVLTPQGEGICRVSCTLELQKRVEAENHKL